MRSPLHAIYAVASSLHSPLPDSPPRAPPSHFLPRCHTCDTLILLIWERGVGQETPLETRVCHGRLSFRELPRIGPEPAVFGWRWRWQHGQFFEICLINDGGLCLSTRLPGVWFVYASIPPVNQFMSKTWPVFTHFLKRTYVAFLLRGYEQVVGQGVAGID